jgi:protein SCO1/2
MHRSSTRLLIAAAICVAALCPYRAKAQYARPKIATGVGIDQKLNGPVPLDLMFRDENGQLAPLRTWFGDKPVVIEMVYFSCTSLCPMTLMESVNSLKRVALEPGRDYNVLVVSIDPHDNPQTAKLKKADYAAIFSQKPVRNVANFDAGWHFLTGTPDSIAKLADAVGFRYRWDDATQQFVHAGGIMVATPEGKLSRYFFGIQYAPPDMRMALVDASSHRIGSPVDYITLFCFHYDAAQGKYTLAIVNLLKLAGGVTVLALAGLLFILMRQHKEVRHAG